MTRTLEPACFDALFSNAEIARAMRAVAPAFHDAANAFWGVPLSPGHLSARMKELILFAMHVSATALNVGAVERQVRRVLAAGGTPLDLADVVTTIASLANHSVYASVPILEDEWRTANGDAAEDAVLDPRMKAVKERFTQVRGFWNAEREPLMRQMPDYFAALSDIATVTWEQGSLTRKEREFICIGIDCTVTHTYTPGLRIHIRNAIREGSTREELLEIFQLAATVGLEGYVLTAEALFGPQSSPSEKEQA